MEISSQLVHIRETGLNVLHGEGALRNRNIPLERYPQLKGPLGGEHLFVSTAGQ